MNKILRISMIAVLALIANFSFAGVSTIDFTKLSVNNSSLKFEYMATRP